MKVHVAPASVLSMPDTSFFESVGLRLVNRVDLLHQTYVAHDGNLGSQQADVR